MLCPKLERFGSIVCADSPCQMSNFQIVWLYQISEPTTFTMQCIDYELPFVPPNSEEDADNDGALKNG